MSTTQLFAELLIIGVGALIWIALLVAAITGWQFNQSVLEKILFSLWPVLAVITYVFGILLDRIVYSVFDHKKNEIKCDVFYEKHDYLPAKISKETDPPANVIEKIVSDSSDHLRSMIDYNKSRGRICRSWCINFMLIGITFSIWQIRSGSISITSLHGIYCIAFTLAFISYKAGVELEKDHYNHIKWSYYYVRNYKNIKHQNECDCPAANQQNKHQ